MKAEVFLLFSVSLTMLLFLTQTTMSHIGAEMGEDEVSFLNYNDSVIKQFDTGNYTITTDYVTGLPSSNQEVGDDTGNIFTDTFKTIRDWISTASGGFKYIIDMFTAVPNFLKQLFGQDYGELGFALGFFWHVISFLVFIAWIRGVNS